MVNDSKVTQNMCVIASYTAWTVSKILRLRYKYKQVNPVSEDSKCPLSRK